MRNPFIMMALAIASARTSMAEALRAQNIDRNQIGMNASLGRSRIPGKPQPAGSKLARQAKRGTITIKSGRRGLVGHLGRVSA
jgi:hypothetical protein